MARSVLHGMGDVVMQDINEQRLESWKEISGHLRKSVRTIQRWERRAGLPVRRVRVGGKSVVFAYRTELDQWWTHRSRRGWRRWLGALLFWRR